MTGCQYDTPHVRGAYCHSGILAKWFIDIDLAMSLCQYVSGSVARGCLGYWHTDILAYARAVCPTSSAHGAQYWRCQAGTCATGRTLLVYVHDRGGASAGWAAMRLVLPNERNRPARLTPLNERGYNDTARAITLRADVRSVSVWRRHRRARIVDVRASKVGDRCLTSI
jgi:hypothetical protein